jgi:hypothetical protein
MEVVPTTVADKRTETDAADVPSELEDTPL